LTVLVVDSFNFIFVASCACFCFSAHRWLVDNFLLLCDVVAEELLATEFAEDFVEDVLEEFFAGEGFVREHFGGEDFVEDDTFEVAFD
jgi:hypothetical protein